MRCLLASFTLAVVAALTISIGCVKAERGSESVAVKDPKEAKELKDSVAEKSESERYTHLTDEDFQKVATQLGIETAAIKAVVSIEAGSAMKGFWAPGIPVINFDQTMYRKYAASASSKVGAKGESVPSGLTGYARQEWTLLINARKVNAQGANMGTFWGMFQIGGFNYKLCGCESVDEFVRRMAYSEFEQLELFAAFIEKTGMVKDIRVKNWSGFARRYNGPNYARRGYHTKMASAYSKFKAQEAKTKNPPKSGDAHAKGVSLKAAGSVDE